VPIGVSEVLYYKLQRVLETWGSWSGAGGVLYLHLVSSSKLLLCSVLCTSCGLRMWKYME
jgi:hypothetical protein